MSQKSTSKKKRYKNITEIWGKMPAGSKARMAALRDAEYWISQPHLTYSEESKRATIRGFIFRCFRVAWDGSEVLGITGTPGPSEEQKEARRAVVVKLCADKEIEDVGTTRTAIDYYKNKMTYYEGGQGEPRLNGNEAREAKLYKDIVVYCLSVKERPFVRQVIKAIGRSKHDAVAPKLKEVWDYKENNPEITDPDAIVQAIFGVHTTFGNQPENENIEKPVTESEVDSCPRTTLVEDTPKVKNQAEIEEKPTEVDSCPHTTFEVVCTPPEKGGMHPKYKLDEGLGPHTTQKDISCPTDRSFISCIQETPLEKQGDPTQPLETENSKVDEQLPEFTFTPLQKALMDKYPHWREKLIKQKTEEAKKPRLEPFDLKSLKLLPAAPRPEGEKRGRWGLHEEPEYGQHFTCKLCGGDFVWTITKDGQNVMTDYDGPDHQVNNEPWNPKYHVEHNLSCRGRNRNRGTVIDIKSRAASL